MEEQKSFSFKPNRPIELRAFNYFTGEMLYGPPGGPPSASWILGLGDTFPRMQCLGFTNWEKYGSQKIWEGDILQNEEGELSFVSYVPECVSFGMRDSYGNLLTGLRSSMKCRKVVGNIYQNPEILSIDLVNPYLD